MLTVGPAPSRGKRTPDDNPVERKEEVVSSPMQDLTKGYVPLIIIATFVIPTAIYIGLYLGKRDSASETLGSQITSLQTQVSALTNQVTQISIAVAKGPTLPENVAFKADLLRLCLANKNLICPQF